MGEVASTSHLSSPLPPNTSSVSPTGCHLPLKGKASRAAFVSTNSITQGEQVAALWKKLLEVYKIHIDFAWRTFRWNSESADRAAVHCVIIGFSTNDTGKEKMLFAEGKAQVVKHINPYLIDAPDVLIENQAAPLCSVPKITKGNYPSDGGNLILSDEEQRVLLEKSPELAPYVRRYVGARDFINNDQVRYCLWLKNAPPNVYRKNAEVMRRLDGVREMRAKSSAAPTRAMAETPYLFFSAPQTDNDYLCIPEVSSENRKYIPVALMNKEMIAANTVLIAPNATLYHFGVVTSNVHNAWMRAIAGRLKSDYRYSGSIVYNNFPWPSPSDEQRQKIEQTAQAILDARAKFPDASLADLYDENTMPSELRKAHQANDKAVMTAYGFKPDMEEAEIVAELMKRYQRLAERSEKKRKEEIKNSKGLAR